MSTPQPIPARLVQRSTTSSPLPARPPTAGSTDPPTPRPSQLPFPGGASSPSTEHPPSSVMVGDDTLSTTPNANTVSNAGGGGGITERDSSRPFLPFFTLIQDASTASHFHPTVRYVFSDDEFDPVAILASHNQARGGAAAAAAPGSGNTSEPNSLSGSGTGGGAGAAATGAGNSGSGSQADVDSGSGQFGKATKNRASERVILVDVAADGEGILSAHSLSSEWQVNGVSVSKAPTWMSDDTASTNTNAVGDGGLMLTIEGVGRKGKNSEKRGATGATGTEGLEELVGLYQERLERLQGVVDWAEGRKVIEGTTTTATLDTTEGSGGG